MAGGEPVQVGLGDGERLDGGGQVGDRGPRDFLRGVPSPLESPGGALAGVFDGLVQAGIFLCVGIIVALPSVRRA